MSRNPALAPSEMYPVGVAGVSVRYVRTDSGLRVRVAESGATSNPLVVLLHGWGCSLYSFRFQLQRADELGVRFCAVDLQGHGLSDKPEDAQYYTLDGMTHHLGEVVAALQISGCTMLGHSMGGRIATEFALRDTGCVRRLILVNPVGFGPMPHITMARPFVRPSLGRVLPAPLPSWLVRVPVGAVYGSRSAPTPRDVEEYRAPTQFRSFLNASALLLRHFDWKEVAPGELRLLREKATVVLGELDRVVQGVRAGRHIGLRDAGWRVEVVGGVAHVVHEEAPEELLRVIAPKSNG